MGNSGWVDGEISGDLVQDSCGNDGVLEEGAYAAAVGLAFDDQHALGVADLADGVVDVNGFRLGISSGEVALQVSVCELWGGRAIEAEGYLADDVAIAVSGVEDAAAVGEAALLVGEGDEGESFEVEDADVGDRVGDLLAVGADVLDGRAADAAGNAGEAFDAADSLLTDVEDKVVPLGARSGGNVKVAAGGVGLRRGGNRYMDDEPVEAAVADQEVTATAENE